MNNKQIATCLNAQIMYFRSGVSLKFVLFVLFDFTCLCRTLIDKELLTQYHYVEFRFGICYWNYVHTYV